MAVTSPSYTPTARPPALDPYELHDRRRFQALAHQDSAALFLLDLNVVVRYANPAARDAFDAVDARSSVPLLGRHLFSLVYHADLHAIRRMVNDARHELDPGQDTLVRLYVRRDRWQWFVIRTVPMAHGQDAIPVVALTACPLAS